jgi:hypothetical protein
MGKHRCHLPAGLLASSLTALLWAASAQADIPAFYTGTPYMGVAQQIPGHIELADLDLGGFDVAWNTDHNRMTDGPQSGYDYRAEDMDLPNINKTNGLLNGATGELREDFWEVDGTPYPSADDLHWHYLGAAHVDDWIRITVDVQQAGMYNVSSNWACANVNCGCSIWFNDGSDPNGPDDGINKSGVVPLDGTNDYHLWRAYPNFAQVELTAGLQVMTFRVENADHLQYGFLDFALQGGAGAGGAGGTAGAAGAGGAAGAATAGAGGADTNGGASGGDTAGAASAGMAGSSSVAGGTAGTNAAAGMPGSSGSGGSPTASAAGSNAAPMGAIPSGNDVDTESGCTYAGSRETSRAAWVSLAFLIGTALRLRRRRH